MEKYIIKIQNSRNFIYGFIIIFILIILVMPPNYWSGNEENYLGLAWRKFSPDNVVQVSALRDGANHRFLFEYLTGFLIYYLGFEWTHTLCRIILALLYSASLATFFRSLGFSIITSCTIILTFLWLNQHILGWESLLGGFEPKTLAYPFVFFSFSASIKRKFNYAYLLLAVATYFHFLIGGFWFFMTWLFQLYLTRNLKLTLLQSLKYLIACAPLFLMIGTVQLQAVQDTVNSTPTASWIYAYFRNPHHVAPFKSALGIASWYKHGIVFLFGLTIISVIIYRYARDEKERKLSQIILFLNLYLVFSLIISYFDQGGILGKLYLFRPSSMTLFLTLCLYALLLKNRLSRDAKPLSFVALIFISCLVIPVLPGHDYLGIKVVSLFLGKDKVESLILEKRNNKPDFVPNFSLSVPHRFLNNHNDSQLEEIIKSSQNTAIFLIDPKLENQYLSFERKYNRPTLVFKKFVPTTTSDIVRWFNLLNMKEELFDQGCPAKIMEKYPIEYLVARNDRKSLANCGKELFRNQSVKLIKIESKSAKAF